MLLAACGRSSPTTAAVVSPPQAAAARSAPSDFATTGNAGVRPAADALKSQAPHTVAEARDSSREDVPGTAKEQETKSPLSGGQANNEKGSNDTNRTPDPPA